MNTPEMTNNEPEKNKQPLASPETEPRRYPEPGKTYYYIHDHNNNVVGMMDKDANIVARYAYDPFGNIIHSSGEMAEANPIRFSSEFHNRVTGLTDYLYRSYNPKDGRWTQRDPIQEQGGLNLYNFVGNDPMNQFDLLGENSQPYYTSPDKYFAVHGEFNKGNNTSNVHIQILKGKGSKESNKFVYRNDMNPPDFYNKDGQKLPKDIRTKIRKQADKELGRALRKAANDLDRNGGIAPKYGGGRMIPAISLFVFFIDSSCSCAAYAEAYDKGELGKMDKIYESLIEKTPEMPYSITMTRVAIRDATESIHNDLRKEAAKNRK